MRPPPLRRLGQHFLTDPSILGRIADALDLSATDCVVEIGAGRGALTAVLARRCSSLVAIEVDRALVPLLRERFAADSNVRIVEGDALQLPLGELTGCPRYKLAGNVPYYITTPLIFHALRRPRPDVCVFLVQTEVAQRACAVPGGATYGALSVNLQVLVQPEIVLSVPPGAFRPRPAVDSSLLRLVPRADSVFAAGEEEGFRVFVQGVFAQRRKQLQRILRSVHSMSQEGAAALLSACGLDPSARPETVTPAGFARLYEALRRPPPAGAPPAGV